MNENWINSVMDSADNRSKVMPDQQLLERLRSIPGSQTPVVKISTINWMLAASVILLLIINTAIFTEADKNQVDSNSNSSESSFQDTYFDYVNTEL